MSVFRYTGRLFLRVPSLASLVYKVRFCEASAVSGDAVRLVETRVDWASQLTAHPARIRGRKWLPGSHSPKFPEFLAPPKDGYVNVFTPIEKLDCSPEQCAPSMRQVIHNVMERRKEGALLFRGMPLATAEDFSRALVNLGLKLTSYKGGGGIRHRLAEAVDTASDEPPDVCIEPHHDLAYTNHYPEKIMFFCIDPPPPGTGGETVLADVRDILPRLDRDVVEKFRKLGVMYTHHLPSRGPGIYNSWQETFQMEDKSEVEEHMKAHNIHWKWHDDGAMTNWTVLPAMHKYRGDWVWFTVPHANNSSYMKNNPYWVDKAVPDHLYPQHTYYGDGSDIEQGVLQHIRESIWQVTMGFQLQKGDLLVLNNIYCQHARLSFTGKRKLAVALAMQDQDYPEDS
ncbi:Hypp7136 [Branchiostoma lanceolatum]|uniref:Hypp7136 protein n=1 Tax=Branchiostoma lanceolatum TaxID=7740 RepID=A0A8J9YXZ7_BRALA|nr:Hypp7136 [Branchiostoma lanceolatum]